MSFGDWVYPGKLSYILTNQELSTQRNDINFVRNGIKEIVEDVKKKGYQRIWIVGGGKVASSFINLGLVDEYIITVIPMILGSGISLYQSLLEVKLNLISLQSYSSGMVELCYRKR